MITFFIINDEAGHSSPKGMVRGSGGEVDRSITIELYLYIHNARSGVEYV